MCQSSFKDCDGCVKCFMNSQSKEGKCEQRLVNPADHDASIFLPMLDVAVVLQSRTHVPGEQAPAYDPNNSKESVDRKIEVRFETDTAVQNYCHSQSSD